MFDPISYASDDWRQQRQEEDEAIRTVINDPWIGQPYGWHQSQIFTYSPHRSNLVITYEVRCSRDHRVTIIDTRHL